ncbi:MAG: 1-deoxy-D-xylulose-5-phosphate synthase [Clostridia bacterium]|nr:1-deoxy-D-xylulose-5-phosphate synthase [Clostridia bacterium]
MKEILEKVNNVEDLRKLKLNEKEQLAEEIRKFILNIVSENGGHLASNLGIVELTIALHSVFNTPKDAIIWDVGHQTYVHKVITGRKNKMATLRQLDGIAGFPKVTESEFDSFNTGHSSTSISVALGMARANKLEGKSDKVVAVIGDGALTGGMAQEALNDAGSSNADVTVVLNDNEMSISKNVGGITYFLSKLRTKRFYTKTNSRVKKLTLKIPRVGERIVKFAHRMKKGIKQVFIQKMYYEDIGFTYIGPVDGHDIEKLESVFKTSKSIKGPVLIHVVTKKGKGYKIAEENPDKFHSTSSFNIETGKPKKPKKPDYSKTFGDKLVELAKKDEKIVAISAAMIDGTGLKEFKKQFPDRIFDVGIAEQHALGMAAGMARKGFKPVISIYSSFYQRGYDQVIHDICIQNLPVVMCVDRAGIVGNDGETHQGIFDMAFFSIVPNITIMAPKDFAELEKMLEFAVNLNSPVVIRYPRGGEGTIKFNKCDNVELGKAEILKTGEDLTIIAIGKMVERAMEVSNLLKEQNIDCEVINARFVKPLDSNTIETSIRKTKHVITIEDGILHGGLGTSVIELINDCNINDVYMKAYGYDDVFVQHGSIGELEKLNGLDAKSIALSVQVLEKLRELH